MAYVDGFDLDEELYEELQTLADEEGLSIEELIVDILKEEFSLTDDLESDDTDTDDDCDEEDYNSDN